MQNIHRVMKSNLSQTDDYHLNTAMQLNRLWIDVHYIARPPAGGACHPPWPSHPRSATVCMMCVIADGFDAVQLGTFEIW